MVLRTRTLLLRQRTQLRGAKKSALDGIKRAKFFDWRALL